jgi:SAM-dependent methyltransferase
MTDETDRREMPPYSVLAAGYDVVMEHVDYAFWAEYVHGLIRAFHPEAQTVLELGCGTGSLALELAPRGPYRYAGTDAVPEMIRVARAKAEMAGADLQFEVADFTNYRVGTPVDVVLLLYDGLNYLLETDPIRSLFRCTYDALKPGGLFLFDQSTPANSENNEALFEDAGAYDAFRFRRRSRYDRETRLHTTTFELTVTGRSFLETHVQKAYTPGEIRALVEEAGFEVAAAYDGFSQREADEDSERIHWVVHRPAAPEAS